MRYDFRKVQEAITVSGKTLRAAEELTGVPYTTIGRALKTGRAHQSTALRLIEGFRSEGFDIVMEDILVQPRRKKYA